MVCLDFLSSLHILLEFDVFSFVSGGPPPPYPGEPAGYPAAPPQAAYPQQPYNSYPGQPSQPYPAYPAQPAAGYPQQPNAAYPTQPPAGYAQQPYVQPTGNAPYYM